MGNSFDKLVLRDRWRMLLEAYWCWIDDRMLSSSSTPMSYFITVSYASTSVTFRSTVHYILFFDLHHFKSHSRNYRLLIGYNYLHSSAYPIGDTPLLVPASLYSHKWSVGLGRIYCANGHWRNPVPGVTGIIHTSRATILTSKVRRTFGGLF